ncbi:MAG: lamin tail domain-containing protein [Crocinitomicaceae bacterium]|nr:lamin tail domain-containing protein [Crocinitomicaceae bacterium]
MRYIFLIVVILTSYNFFAQISDDFNDGDFISGTVWTGTDTDYTVNASTELQLNNSVASTSYLSTPHGLINIDTKEWRFWTRQSFSPSSGNYGRVYLTSSSSDLTTDPDGFYLQLGESGSNDAVRLFKCQTGVHTELLAATLGQIASSFSIGVRVVRDNTGIWSLYIDYSGGENYSLEGTVTDATNLTGTHFGMLNVYTSSNATDFYYDTIYVGNEILDTDAPVLMSAGVISATQIDVLFDEALDQTSAEFVSNYNLSPSIAITGAVLDGTNLALVHLTTLPLSNGQNYVLTTDQIEDVSGNISGNQQANFGYYLPEVPIPGDVVINEFLCDQTPQVGLPLAEYVEIYNKSAKVFDVQNWKLGDASGDGTITQNWLLPGEYMILTGTSNVDSFNVATGVTSFPSLNNSGDNIVLRDDLGNLLDSISYTSDWYQDINKEDGGYSIERINPNDPCSDISDWRASNDLMGGTPGIINSIFDATPDTETPVISQLIALAPNFLEVYYSEGMDSTSLSDAVISISPNLTIQNNYVLSEFPAMQTLEFVEALVESETYTIELQNVGDCWMNISTLIGTFALPATADLGDLIVNEILADPISGGADWIEVYNASNKLIDLENWQIANFDDDTIANFKTFTEHFLLYPNTYVVLGEDTTQIIEHYPLAVSGRMIEMDLPTLPNDSGTVYLIKNNQVMDKVSYSSDWHFQLLDSEDGVSLERIDVALPSNSKDNWHSAAEAIGFATPGAENSQYYPAISNGEFSYSSEIISPDNDGFQDVLQINYELISPGNIGSFNIYDDRGRLIATVIKSELLSAKGTFIWDGIKDDNTKATIGTYVGVFEAFDIDGGIVFTKTKSFVVAGKL